MPALEVCERIRAMLQQEFGESSELDVVVERVTGMIAEMMQEEMLPIGAENELGWIVGRSFYRDNDVRKMEANNVGQEAGSNGRDGNGSGDGTDGDDGN